MEDYSKTAFDVIIQAGQSNAQGCGYEPMPELFADSGALYLNPDLAIVKAEGVPYGESKIGEFSLSFAQKYVANDLSPGRKLLIIRAAVGGTGFLDNRWKENDDLFLTMINMIRHARSLNADNKFVALLWHQGETDALFAASFDTHFAHLSRLVELTRAETGERALPFVAGDFVQEWKNANIALSGPVADSIRAVCASAGHGAFVETVGLLSNNQKAGGGDDIHFCNEALYLLGLKYYELYKKI